jgi:hypothetical protein
MMITTDHLQIIADLTARLCECRLDDMKANNADKAPELFGRLLGAYQSHVAEVDAGVFEIAPDAGVLATQTDCAPVPTFTRCRGCQSHRQNHGESDNGAVMEYCSKDGCSLLPDGESCGQFRHQTQQDALESV